MTRPSTFVGCRGYPSTRWATSGQRDRIENLVLALPEPVRDDVEKALRTRRLREYEARELIAVLHAAAKAWRRAG